MSAAANVSMVLPVAFEHVGQYFFERQPGLACGENREDDNAVVGHEENDKESFAESDDAHPRVMQRDSLAAQRKVGKVLDVIREGSHVVAGRDRGITHGRDGLSEFSKLLPSLACQDQAKALLGHFSPNSARTSLSV